MLRRLVLVTVLAFIFSLVVQSAHSPRALATGPGGPSILEPEVQFELPENNAPLSGQVYWEAQDPTDNFYAGSSLMGPRRHVRLGDAAPALDEHALYMDSFNHVALHNGDFIHRDEILRVPGTGLDFSVIISYSSHHAAQPSPFGFGWDSNVFSRVVGGGGSWTLYNGFHETRVFNQSLGGSACACATGSGCYSDPQGQRR